MDSRQYENSVGISIEILWADIDVFKVKVISWNGWFGGVADIYVEIGGLDKLAELIDGFPENANDARETILGAFGPEYAGGAASLRLFCIDRAGHAYVESKVESGDESAGVFQSATSIIPVEASAIDRFVRQLKKLERDKEGAALLRGRS